MNNANFTTYRDPSSLGPSSVAQPQNTTAPITPVRRSRRGPVDASEQLREAMGDAGPSTGPRAGTDITPPEISPDQMQDPNGSPMSLDLPELTPRARELKDKLEQQVADITSKYQEQRARGDRLHGQAECLQRAIDDLVENREKERGELLANGKKDRDENLMLLKNTVQCIRPFLGFLVALNDEIHIDRETDVDYMVWRTFFKKSKGSLAG